MVREVEPEQSLEDRGSLCAALDCPEGKPEAVEAAQERTVVDHLPEEYADEASAARLSSNSLLFHGGGVARSGDAARISSGSRGWKIQEHSE